MIIDCARCCGRPTECADCVVSVVLGPHPAGIDLDADEQTAVAVLAGSGLVPPLRLMPLCAVAPLATAAPSSADPGAAGESVARAGPSSNWSRRQRAG